MKKFSLLLLFFPLILLADMEAEFEQALKAFSSETPPPTGLHCGFKDLIELRQKIKYLSPSSQALARQVLYPAQPSRQDSVLSASGHFMLHYDREGRHAVPPQDIEGNGIPDYVDSAAVYLDKAWQVEIAELGFRPPPDQDGNALSVYPIYFTNFGYYGLTTFSEIDIPALPGLNYTSYIELHNNYESTIFFSKGLEGLKVTAAHEFNHAIQLGYNLWLEDSDYFSDLYLMEMTSTWLEDYVFDEVNDYIFYLDYGGETRSFFKNLFSISFTSVSNYDAYANSLFFHLVEKRYGSSFVVQLWEKIMEEVGFAALQSTLAEYGSSFAEIQNIYAGWLYFTGTRTVAGAYFPEAALYPETEINQGREALDLGLEKLAMRQIKIYPEYDQLLGIRITSSNNQGKFSHIINNTELLSVVSFNTEQTIAANKNKPLIVVLSNPTAEKVMDLDYTMQPKSVSPGPNPIIVTTTEERIYFKNVPAHSKVSIFNLNGALIEELNLRDDSADHATWDMRDQFGKRVASGIYLYHLRSGSFETLGKFAVIRP